MKLNSEITQGLQLCNINEQKITGKNPNLDLAI